METVEITSSQVPETDHDPYAPEWREDPYPLYRELLELGPVFYMRKYETYGVARWDPVTVVLRDHENFTSTAGASLHDIRNGEAMREASAIVSADPPDHTQMRAVMTRVLAPTVVRSWAEQFQKAGRALVEELVAKGSFDTVTDLAEIFVTDVFPKALGIDITREQAVVIGDYGFNGLGPHNDLFWDTHERMAEHQEYSARSRTRDVVKPGGWAHGLFDAEEEGKLPPGTASSMMMSVIRGGMDTTISGIGTAIAQLAQNPDQWALLRADPNLARAAFEEAIRLESPLSRYYRATTRNVVFKGYSLKDDTKIQMFIAAANRDPEKFKDPDRYDITRNTFGHVAFGGGVHTCIGQMIARVEAEAVLKVLAETVSELHVEGPLLHRHSNALRTYASIPTRVVPA